ncbi:6-phosphogluconolactonase [Lewinella antarctica]|uniref:6-phosphogluconolactonase n=1 Tax=Neolewinella antarctica TaxID=442734 RepID=A0ABX0XB13_9BACT|nr:6-phosphogluconolactonase [Neolewinella antarctica]
MDENTPGKARGISVYDWLPGEAGLKFLGFVKTSNPSYVLTDQSRQIIYAVNEHSAAEGAAVVAFKVSRKKEDKLSFREIGQVPLAGDDPCHLAFAGRNLVVSCYTSGQVMILPLDVEGALGTVSQTFTFAADNGREAHAHCSVFQPLPAQILVADLGSDRLRVLRREDDGSFTHAAELDLEFPDKQGPRHVALHPTGQYAVVNGEREGRVRLLTLSGDRPRITHTANALPERVLDEAWGAAIRISKNGKMVYTTDRNFSVVHALRIDERSAVVRFRHSDPSGGDQPRDVILSPDGDWLFTANTASSSVGIFKIDPSGELTHYRTVPKVPTPTSFAWL